MQDEYEYVKPVKTVVTHNGQFHMDEVSAIAILKLSFSKYEFEIIRTRDPEIISKAQEDPEKFVVDVGHVYDHNKNCYDHHQTSFNDGFGEHYNHITPLSSCGLVFRHYGKQLINNIGTPEQNKCIDLDYVLDYIYKNFILPIDAHDNGVTYCDSNLLKFNPLELGSTISNFNGEIYNNDEQLIRFKQAVEIMTQIITHCVSSAIDFSYKYQKNLQVFEQAFKKRFWPELLVLKEPLNNVTTYLKRYDPTKQVKFIISPKPGSIPEQWNIWTVNCEGEKFKTLVPLITQKEAEKYVGENEVVFIHKACFTGATYSIGSAIQVARESLRRNWTIPQQQKNMKNMVYSAFVVGFLCITWYFSM